jgi:hypothetical protein
VRIQNFNREFSWTRAPSLHELLEEGLDTVSMPNERTCREMLIPQRMARPGPSKAVRQPSQPCSPPGHGTAPTPSHDDVVLLQQFTPFPVTYLCCLLCRVDDIGEKNCCQNSIRPRAMTNPPEKFLDLIEQRVNRPIR